MPTLSKAEHLHIRASERDKQTLSRAARLKNMSISQFLLQSALPVANEILSHEKSEIQTAFQLDSEAWNRFTQMLDAPSRPLPELKKLLLSKPVWKE